MLKQMKGKVDMKRREEKGKGKEKDWEGRKGKGRIRRKESKEAMGGRTGKGKEGYRKDRQHKKLRGKVL